MKNTNTFDRTVEDVGNILNLEHFNFTVPDQELASLFYVSGLGFTRDPYMDFATFNMWINVGEQQFHLPKNNAQVFRGHVALVIPDHQGLKRRLDFINRFMEGTKYAWHSKDDHIQVNCPWGNEFHVYQPNGSQRLQMDLGIAYAEMVVAPGTAEGIARFYDEVFATPVSVRTDGESVYADVRMGFNQSFIFRESTEEIPAYDGHHIAIYVANFSSPHQKLQECGAITEESDQHQYRFQSIIDPNTGEVLAELEHEVRSLHHPMKRRTLVNRNSAQTFGNYRAGRDMFVPT